MAITRLETFASDHGTLVRLRTDDGDAGIGAVGGGGEAAVRVFHDLIAPHAVGEDPTDIEGLIDGIVEARERPRPYKHAGTYALRALCGLDTALWDLAGKREGKGVCELLGGTPGTVPVYGSRLRRDTEPEEEAAACVRAGEEHGLEAFKLKIGKRLGYRTGEDRRPGRTAALVPAVREAIGDDATLFVDANGAYDPDAAVEAAEEILRPADVAMFEEPCPYWELAWTAAVREALDIPVSGGEQNGMVSQWGNEWERIVGMPAVDVVQPDVDYVGGVTRTMRVADMAADAGLPCVPHAPSHGLKKVFTLHLVAALSDTGPYPFEYKLPDEGGHGMYAPEPIAEDGAVSVPDGPGWGIEVDPEWLATARYERTEAR